MSGKPYTIQEMKLIVDYLVENKLYGEVKARKMWVDFANTKLTSRTWQSLKETFLKRILPDILNPYFQLTNEQISCFRARCDLIERNKNKLEVHTISVSDDDSNLNGQNPKDNEPSDNEEETTAGENTTCSKVPVRSRSSADTVILENCYETAEEIRKDLESDEKPRTTSKSFRDCITYSEPLAIIQEVLHDFASEPEDSDREGKMEIVENVPEESSEDMQEIPEPINDIPNNKIIATDVAKNAKGLSAEMVEEVLAQELEGGSKLKNKSPKKQTTNLTNEKEVLPVINSDEEAEISSVQAEYGTEIDNEANSEAPQATKLLTTEITEKLVVQNSETVNDIVVTDSHSDPSSALNHSNTTVDASLPNNPEALIDKNSKDVETKAESKETPESAVKVLNNSDKTPSSKKATRKRSGSVDNSNTIDNKKKKLDNTLELPIETDTKITESHLDTDGKPNANEEVIQPEVIKKPWLEGNPIEINKPSTSFETHVVNMIETEKSSNTKETPEITNPCLQNISLFDEQFNKTKYNMSESSDTEQNKKETQISTQEVTGSKPSEDVVVLKSHSESDSEEVQASPKKKQRAGVLTSKSERDKAISHMFGFTSGGGVGAKRKRQLSRRRRTISHNNNASHHTAVTPTNSSDWTSESASEEYVSPPRSRKYRNTRKYLKPQPAKISSLAEEGGLFVMYGKKIYPVVKDGKIVKNYITYLPESESEEEGGAFWKSKYVEEKKKAAELKKLLEAKEALQIKETKSPDPQPTPPSNSRRDTLAVEPANGVGREISVPVPVEKKEEPIIKPEKITIKFTRNNEAVHLEGHWPQIHPVLEEVVNLFHKESEPSVHENKSKKSGTHPELAKELSSGLSTPIIIEPVEGWKEVHEKVNKIEKEIFKEIEELDKEEENVPNGQATNVTKRKLGRPRKSSSTSHSPEKQQKTSVSPDTKEPEENSRPRRQKAKKSENINNSQETLPKRQIRSPRKVLNETININESKTRQTRQSTQKLDTSVTNEDEEVRYMLPPKTTRLSLRSPANKKTNHKKR